LEWLQAPPCTLGFLVETAAAAVNDPSFDLNAPGSLTRVTTTGDLIYASGVNRTIVMADSSLPSESCKTVVVWVDHPSLVSMSFAPGQRWMIKDARPVLRLGLGLVCLVLDSFSQVLPESNQTVPTVAVMDSDDEDDTGLPAEIRHFADRGLLDGAALLRGWIAEPRVCSSHPSLCLRCDNLASFDTTKNQASCPSCGLLAPEHVCPSLSFSVRLQSAAQSVPVTLRAHLSSGVLGLPKVDLLQVQELEGRALACVVCCSPTIEQSWEVVGKVR